MKKDILCYILLIISISIFIYTNVFLAPIELKEGKDHDPNIDYTSEEFAIENIYIYGLKNKELVSEKYVGKVNLERAWINYKLLFTEYKNKFIEDYDIYNSAEESEEKIAYKKDIYAKYGINTQEEIDKLYQYFKNISDIQDISVVDNTISATDDGILFDIKAIDSEKSEYLFSSIIYNDYIEENVYLKILPKEIKE